MKNKIYKFIGICFIIAGLSVIIYAFASKGVVEKESNDMVEQYDTYINWIQDNEIPQQDIDKVTEDVTSLPEQTTVQDAPPPIPEGLLGIMEIDKIDLSVTIAEGTDNKSIVLSVGHFINTAMPGEKGNFAVVGHRSYRYGAYFNRLDEVEKGDIIRVRTVDGTYEYEVDDKFVVEPTQTDVLDSTEDATITLVTCTPIRTATHRLIIKGHLISS